MPKVRSKFKGESNAVSDNHFAKPCGVVMALENLHLYIRFVFELFYRYFGSLSQRLYIQSLNHLNFMKCCGINTLLLLNSCDIG